MIFSVSTWSLSLNWEVINELAAAKGKVAKVALRINPNVSANTHHYITTGLSENKFGINMSELDKVVDLFPTLANVQLIGIHFHIGSQITDMTSFQGLCVRVNELQDYFVARNISLQHINVGGGLGINYEHPNHFPIPDFRSVFQNLPRSFDSKSRSNSTLRIGRAVVAQCGSLISKVLYVKEGTSKKFAILDAGFTDLIRPALYQAYHLIENLSSDAAKGLMIL